MLTRAEMASVLMAAREDPRALIEQALVIRTKELDLSPFTLNPAQVLVHDAIARQRAMGKPIRQMLDKARQLGLSTYAAARTLIHLLTHPGARGFCLAHERLQAQKLMMMYQLFCEQSPLWLGLEFAPSANRLRLVALHCSDGDIEIGSELYAETATGKEVGRGDTLSVCHLSEVAWWPDPVRTLTGLLRAVPSHPETMILVESTPNGVVGIGEQFKKMWDDAVDGRSDYMPTFLGWYLAPEYRIDVPRDYELELTAEEQMLTRDEGVTLGQFAWWRQQLANDYGGDIDLCNQELASTPETSFIASGARAFPTSILIEYKRASREKVFKDGEMSRHSEATTLFVPRVKGRYRLFEAPESGHEYMIGVDTALGVQGGDLSAAVVLDRTTVRVVATFLATIDPFVYAHELNKLGHYYNTAMIAVEVNNTGLSTQNELVSQLRYPRPYRWRVLDNVTGGYTNKLGWQTSSRSRPLLIDSFAFGLRHHLIGIPDSRLLDQLIEYDANETNRPGEDDLADAALIAFHVHLTTPMRDGRRPRTYVEAPAEIVGEPPPVLDPMSQEAWDSVDRLMKRLARKDDDTGLYGVPYAEKDRDPWPEVEY